MTGFTSAAAKIARADTQIRELVTEMDAFCTDIKGSIVHQVDGDSDTQAWIYRGTTPVAPFEWSIRIGEILYNLRSALDHIVWQLVLANGEKPSRGNEFPVVNTPEAWPSLSRRKLEGVQDGAKEAIRRLQPCTGGINLPLRCICVLETAVPLQR